jgi:hypothetical protein
MCAISWRIVLARCSNSKSVEDVVRLGVHDAAEVLHRPGVEVGHPQLVVLRQRVAHAELLVEEVEALLRHEEQVVRVQILLHGLAHEQAHVDAVVRLADLVVRPGAQRGHVRAHLRGRLEVHDLAALHVTRGHLVDLGVRDDLPVARHGCVPRVDALEVGLVEAGEGSLRVRGLELAVEVDLLVDRVQAAVQALPRRGEREVAVDDQRVVGREAGEREALLGGPAGGVDFHAIEVDCA